MSEIAPDEQVFVVASSSRHGVLRLHTNRTCRILKQRENVVEKQRDVYPDDQPVCTYCAGEFEPSGAGSDHYDALKRAADD